jgi:hypothetical protein
MQTSGVPRKIEIAANVTIAVSIIVIAILFGLRRWRSAPSPEAGGFVVGQALKVDGFTPEAGRRSLLVFLRPDCPFCERSHSFLKRVVAEFSECPHLDVRFVLPPPAPGAREYLSDAGIGDATLLVSDLTAAGVPGVPSVALVDEDGAILRSWVGKLPTQQEENLLSAARGSCHPSSAL